MLKCEYAYSTATQRRSYVANQTQTLASMLALILVSSLDPV